MKHADGLYCKSSSCTGCKGHINEHNFRKRYLSQFVIKPVSKANLRVGAWCVRIVEHSVGRMQDVE
jgi:hypothetical protein